MKFARKTDILIVAAIAAAGLIIWLVYAGTAARHTVAAEIYHHSELVKTVALTGGQAGRFSLDGVPNVVFEVFDDGSIAFFQSDCPDKICIRSGRLRLAGQMAACLPNRLYIKIVSTGPPDSGAPDIVIGPAGSARGT